VTTAIVAMVAVETVAAATAAREIFLWGELQNITY
jgi:hypothetical protein